METKKSVKKATSKTSSTRGAASKKGTKKSTKKATKSVPEIVTERILAQLAQAIESKQLAPWQMPWTQSGRPLRHDGTPYRGINNYLLMGGRHIPQKQLADLMAKDDTVQLKNGAQYDIAVYYPFKTIKETDDSTGEEVERRIRLKPMYHRVMNVSWIEGLPECYYEKVYEQKGIENVDLFIDEFTKREHLDFRALPQNNAYYSPAQDLVRVPEMKQFKNINEYYSTCFHELGHATGHPTRLARFKENDEVIFGNETYSLEELVAEMSAAMLLAECDIVCEETERNTIAYLKGWHARLQSEPNWMLMAAAKAQDVFDFVLGITH